MPETERRRLTVINDNPAFLELMSAILEEDAGYDVTLNNGASTSIDEIAAGQPDLIIIDLLLGGASGWEIATLARADARLAQTPIVVCSADVTALRDRADELERIGNVHVLPKPFGIDDLGDLVARLLGRPSPVSR